MSYLGTSLPQHVTFPSVLHDLQAILRTATPLQKKKKLRTPDGKPSQHYRLKQDHMQHLQT